MPQRNFILSYSANGTYGTEKCCGGQRIFRFPVASRFTLRNRSEPISGDCAARPLTHTSNLLYRRGHCKVGCEKKCRNMTSSICMQSPYTLPPASWPTPPKSAKKGRKSAKALGHRLLANPPWPTGFCLPLRFGLYPHLRHKLVRVRVDAVHDDLFEQVALAI
jgi:hypothetical protein